ncbi:Glycosyl transferase family protein [Bifidobacterium mellis]|uniref:Glycosyl transferase family protein n=2 Tax=Bifidobacterium mellis TaxID=1293823 RepID=A0A0F4L3I1_9BIFI|nr:Glycosyl transferase family protein [Bifidobacterium mellis]
MSARNQSHTPFSLLMAVYAGDTPSFVARALKSDTIEQTLMPNQVVIVCDGPLGRELAQLIDGYPAELKRQLLQTDRAKETPEFTIVRLPTNRGLAHALNLGLKSCKYELVARADSDDISRPSRFNVLIPLLASSGLDALGSAIQEFSNDEHTPGRIRYLPSGGSELRTYATLHSPLHHPSVAFRKTSVCRVGGYPENAGRFEDYRLWETMLVASEHIGNIKEPLVLYRSDRSMYHRRGGMRMFRDELRLQNDFLHDRFINPIQYVRNILIRACYRLLPDQVRSCLYAIMTTLLNRFHGKSVNDSRKK